MATHPSTSQAAGGAQAGELEALDQRLVMHPFSALHTQAQREVVVIASAQGITVTDARGRQYLDAGSGLWCANVGHGRRELAQAAMTQMAQTSSIHSFSNFSNEPLVRLSERLLSLAPPQMRRVIYANSGSEANDTQIKLVWRYHNVLGRPAKKKIISRLGGYHGTTIGAGSLTGLPVVHRGFDMPMPGVIHTLAAEYHRRPPHIHSEEAFSRHLAQELDLLIQREGPETVAAFIAEPIMGSAGVIMPPAGYFREISQVLKKHEVLMVADEVITGFGRTGSWFASPGLDYEPDLITIAKGLTSGHLPMSGCLISQKVCDVLYSEVEAAGYLGHGFTASGHPVAAAVALANLNIIQAEGLLDNAQAVGQYLIDQLREALGHHELVGNIRGRGLMIGVEFDQDKSQRRAFDDVARVSGVLSQACLDEGLIVRGGHGRVVAALAPPLILTRSQADEVCERLQRGVRRFTEVLKTEGLLP